MCTCIVCMCVIKFKPQAPVPLLFSLKKSLSTLPPFAFTWIKQPMETWLSKHSVITVVRPSVHPCWNCPSLLFSAFSPPSTSRKCSFDRSPGSSLFSLACLTPLLDQHSSPSFLTSLSPAAWCFPPLPHLDEELDSWGECSSRPDCRVLSFYGAGQCHLGYLSSRFFANLFQPSQVSKCYLHSADEDSVSLFHLFLVAPDDIVGTR